MVHETPFSPEPLSKEQAMEDAGCEVAGMGVGITTSESMTPHVPNTTLW